MPYSSFISIINIFLDICFKKIENKHCVDGLHRIIDKNTTLDEALSECAHDQFCEKVYDFLCDYRGQFYFCYKGSPDFFSVKRNVVAEARTKKLSSCLFVKEVDCGR